MLSLLKILPLLATICISSVLASSQKIYIPSENNCLSYGESLSGAYVSQAEQYAFINQREHENGSGFYSDVVDNEGNVLTTIFDKYEDPSSTNSYGLVSNDISNSTVIEQDVSDVVQCFVSQVCNAGDKIATFLKDNAEIVVTAAFSSWMRANNDANLVAITGGAIRDFSVQVLAGTTIRWLAVTLKALKNPSEGQDACMNQSDLIKIKAQNDILREILAEIRSVRALQAMDSDENSMEEIVVKARNWLTKLLIIEELGVEGGKKLFFGN